MKRIIFSGVAVAILTTGALAENKQLDDNWFESYKNSLLKTEKQGVPEIRELYGKDSSYAFGGELRVLAITEDEPIELQKKRMKWFDSYSKQFFNSKEEVDATMVPLAVAGYDFNFNGMEFEDRSKADNFKKGFFSGFMFAYDISYRIILNKNRIIENAHKFVLNSTPENLNNLSSSEFRDLLSSTTNEAIKNPTDENIKKLKILQDFMIQKAEDFVKASKDNNKEEK